MQAKLSQTTPSDSNASSFITSSAVIMTTETTHLSLIHPIILRLLKKMPSQISLHFFVSLCSEPLTDDSVCRFFFLFAAAAVACFDAFRGGQRKGKIRDKKYAMLAKSGTLSRSSTNCVKLITLVFISGLFYFLIKRRIFLAFLSCI